MRANLIESARAASRTKETYLSERYHQLARRRGDKKAMIAIAHEILTATRHMLSTGELYRETGPPRYASTRSNAPATARSNNSNDSAAR